MADAGLPARRFLAAFESFMRPTMHTHRQSDGRTDPASRHPRWRYWAQWGATLTTVSCSLGIALTSLPAQGGRHTPSQRAAASSSDSLAAGDASPVEVSATGRMEVGFSPDGSGLTLVLKVIDSAQSHVQILSYSFTSAAITRALLQAIKRGVTVQLVADAKANLTDDRSGKGRAALSALANAGADVRTIDAFPIHHDKVIVVDGRTVELGSFNYSDAAARRNSENVLVAWDNPTLAGVYLRHFERNQRLARVFAPR